jgi:hypothetical protein
MKAEFLIVVRVLHDGFNMINKPSYRFVTLITICNVGQWRIFEKSRYRKQLALQVGKAIYSVSR